MVRLHHRAIVHHDPESSGEPHPGIVRRAKLRRNGSINFPHIQWVEEAGYSGQFQAAGVVGDQEICRRAIAFSLQSIDQFRCAGRQQLDLNAGICRKGVEHRLDEAFRAAGVYREFVGGLGGGHEDPGDEPGGEEQREA